jgi:hypothetical protein
MSTNTVTVVNPVQAHKALTEQLWPYVKAMTMAGHRLDIVARPAKRSAEHSARFHAMLGWLSKNVQWAGTHRSIDEWKRLTVAAWERARGESTEYLPALDGKGIDIVFRHTSEMSGRDMAELIEWVFAWCAEMGHDIPEYQRDLQTGRLVEVRRSKPTEVEA